MRKFRCMTAVIFLLAACPLRAANAQDAETITYIAFGDSIAKGYSSSGETIDPYPDLVQREIEKVTGKKVSLTNTAKNGLTTRKLLEGSLSDEGALRQLEQADIVTVTIGANDLLKGLKSVKLNRLDYQQILDSVDYASFESEYCRLLDRITGYADDSAQIVVTNIYDPASNLKLPGTINKAVRTLIERMNAIIEKHSDAYGYKVADLFHSDICDYVQSDRLHPTQEGQKLIAGNVIEVLGIHPDKSRNEPADRAETMTDDPAAAGEGGESGQMLIYVCLASLIITGVLLIALGIWGTDDKKDKKMDTGDKE